MFGENMLRLDQNLPMDDQYKSTEVKVSPICVIQLIYNSGDVDGPQINAFNLPNDERIVKDRGTSMVIFKYIQEAKFEKILKPIANVCISNNQKNLIDFDSFFTHIPAMSASMTLVPILLPFQMVQPPLSDRSCKSSTQSWKKQRLIYLAFGHLGFSPLR
ncbi:Nudix hydrolase 3 [Linum grandiflorum]